MFSSMKLKSKIKCILEQIVIILLLLLFFLTLGKVLSFVVYRILRGLNFLIPNYFLVNILESLYIIFALVFGALIFFHIFKIRYLDYYVIVKDKTLEPSKNTKEVNDKIYLEKKPETIVIRDPKYSSYRFIKSIFKIMLFFFKILIIAFSFFLLFVLVIQFIMLILSFMIIKTGLFYIGIFSSIVATIILNLTLLYIIYNLIFNKKINKFKPSILFVTSVIFIGIGIGLTLISLKDFDYIDNLDSNYYFYDTKVIEMKDNLFIDNFYKVEFVESDIDDIEITCVHSKFYKFEIDNSYDQIYFRIYDDSNFPNQLNEQLKDFNNRKIVDYSNYKIYVKASKENITKIKENRENYLKLQNQKYYEELNYQNKVDKLKRELQEKEDNIYELESKLEDKENIISELENTLKEYEG